MTKTDAILGVGSNGSSNQVEPGAWMFIGMIPLVEHDGVDAAPLPKALDPEWEMSDEVADAWEAEAILYLKSGKTTILP